MNQTGLIINGEVVLSGEAVLWLALLFIFVLTALISWIKELYESKKRGSEPFRG